jgi:hypothetical protein
VPCARRREDGDAEDYRTGGIIDFLIMLRSPAGRGYLDLPYFDARFIDHDPLTKRLSYFFSASLRPPTAFYLAFDLVRLADLQLGIACCLADGL